MRAVFAPMDDEMDSCLGLDDIPCQLWDLCSAISYEAAMVHNILGYRP